MIKILVVEDNIVQQKIITTKLTQEGTNLSLLQMDKKL